VGSVVVMADDSEIVSQFLLYTCRLRPELNLHAVQAAVKCVDIAAGKPDLIPLTTGSRLSLNSTLNRCYRVSVIST